MKRWIAALVLALLFVAGSAMAQEAVDERMEKVRSVFDVDVRPERIGCAHMDPLLPNFRVPVDFVVAADGTVVPGSVRGRSFDLRTLRHLPAERVREAEAIAETCRFKAARIDGTPVAVRWSERFAFHTDPM